MALTTLFGDVPQPLQGWPSDYREQFWKEYPRRVGKVHAMKALDKAKRAGVEWDKLINAVRTFAKIAATKETRFIPHPATWLNAGRWDDEITAGELKNGTERSAIAAIDRLLTSGFQIAPRPGKLASASSPQHDRLIPKR